MIEQLPDISARTAALIACGVFVFPPLAMCWWDEHVRPHLPWSRR